MNSNIMTLKSGLITNSTKEGEGEYIYGDNLQEPNVLQAMDGSEPRFDETHSVLASF